MFGIIMAAADEVWDVPVGVDAADTFPLNRYLEHTDLELQNALKPVSAATLKPLDGLPTLFMSEIQYDGEEDPFINIRLGRTFDLSVAGGSIAYHFRLDADFGSYPVEDRVLVEQTLGLGRWELTRTHWAVKQGDLDEALAKLGLNAPNPLGPGGEFHPTVEDSPDQPFADSLERYLALVLQDIPDGDMEVFYRGHSDKRYQLEPSLFRRNAKGDYRYLRREASMVRELLSAHPAEFVGDHYMIDRLVRMQHFGLPTRLLDVTSNPLVALYFCCSGVKFDAAGNEVDGEVVIVSTRHDDIKFYDSDTVSCIANLAMLEDNSKNEMNTTLDVAAFNQSPEGLRLLHIIGAEKPYFKPAIVPADLRRIVFVKGRNSNQRVASQSGAFLLFGHDALLPETGHSGLDIKRITIRNKRRILDDLRRMNITSSTIYPGIDKTAAEIAKRYETLD